MTAACTGLVAGFLKLPIIAGSGAELCRTLVDVRVELVRPCAGNETDERVAGGKLHPLARRSGSEHRVHQSTSATAHYGVIKCTWLPVIFGLQARFLDHGTYCLEVESKHNQVGCLSAQHWRLDRCCHC